MHRMPRRPSHAGAARRRHPPGTTVNSDRKPTCHVCARTARNASQPEHRPPSAGIVARCADGDVVRLPQQKGAAADVERRAIEQSEVAGEMTVPQHSMPETVWPPLNRCVHFVNVTNGIEALPVLERLGLPYSFTRIQSTVCEQQRMEALMAGLDPNLLLALALGHCCLVWDLGSRSQKNGVPRSIWYGLEFIRYCLNKVWLGRQTDAYLRQYRVNDRFDELIRGFSKPLKRKLKYYAKYTLPDLPEVCLFGAYRYTARDPDFDFFKAQLQRSCSPSGMWSSQKLPVSRLALTQPHNWGKHQAHTSLPLSAPADQASSASSRAPSSSCAGSKEPPASRHAGSEHQQELESGWHSAGVDLEAPGQGDGTAAGRCFPVARPAKPKTPRDMARPQGMAAWGSLPPPSPSYTDVDLEEPCGGQDRSADAQRPVAVTENSMEGPAAGKAASSGAPPGPHWPFGEAKASYTHWAAEADSVSVLLRCGFCPHFGGWWHRNNVYLEPPASC